MALGLIDVLEDLAHFEPPAARPSRRRAREWLRSGASRVVWVLSSIAFTCASLQGGWGRTAATKAGTRASAAKGRHRGNIFRRAHPSRRAQTGLSPRTSSTWRDAATFLPRVPARWTAGLPARRIAPVPASTRRPPRILPGPLRCARRLGIGDSRACRPGNGRLLTIDDPVRIASITKLHVALGGMRRVEQGKLDLDRDVSDLLGLAASHPVLPRPPDHASAIALASIEPSRRDQLCNSPWSDLPRGRSPLPPEAFDAEHPPGTFFRYSNLNFPAIAAVMESATHERFDLLMDRLVLKPLHLDACFNLSTCAARRSAVRSCSTIPPGAVLRDDLKGKKPGLPRSWRPPTAIARLASYRLASNGALFSPQGGLRISVRDLAKGRPALPPQRTAAEPFTLSLRGEHGRSDQDRLALRRLERRQ